MIRVELAYLLIDERSDEQAIGLREVDGERQFTIVIGLFEAFAIDRIVKGCVCDRPLTHDLLLKAVSALGGALDRVVIDDLRDETYYAKLVLRRGAAEERVDARPSDAITLALKGSVPIFVTERVMNSVASSS